MPWPELSARVRCVWTLRGEASGEAPDLIVPDGCVELVMNGGDAVEERTGGMVRQQPRLLFVGEMRRPVAVQPRGRIDLVGVRFVPGGAAGLLDAAPGEVVDGTFDVDALSAAPLRAGLARARDAAPGDRVRLLQEALAAQVRAGGQGDPLCRRAVDAILAAGGLLRIDELAGRLGVTPRHLERRFRAVVGVSPKSLAQVRRFRTLLLRAEQAGPRKEWARLAAACGYSDQAHLIREFRRFAGRTPARYFAREAVPTLSALF
jgi:AraC-like DNA-binding protein